MNFVPVPQTSFPSPFLLLLPACFRIRREQRVPNSRPAADGKQPQPVIHNKRGRDEEFLKVCTDCLLVMNCSVLVRSLVRFLTFFSRPAVSVFHRRSALTL